MIYLTKGHKVKRISFGVKYKIWASEEVLEWLCNHHQAHILV